MQQFEFMSINMSHPDQAFFIFSIRISAISRRPFSSPLSCSCWSSWALLGTIVGFDVSLNCARMTVMRKTSGLCLHHCALPFVFQSGFPPSCAQVSIPLENLYGLCLCKKVIGFLCWFLTPVLTPVLTSAITLSPVQRRSELCLWGKEQDRVNWQVRVWR